MLLSRSLADTCKLEKISNGQASHASCQGMLTYGHRIGCKRLRGWAQSELGHQRFLRGPHCFSEDSEAVAHQSGKKRGLGVNQTRPEWHLIGVSFMLAPVCNRVWASA